MIYKIGCAFLYLLALLFAAPMLTAICDMFYWFWFNTNWSGLEYNSSARFLVALLFCIPAVPCAVVASITWSVLEENEKLKTLREKIDKEKQNE